MCIKNNTHFHFTCFIELIYCPFICFYYTLILRWNNTKIYVHVGNIYQFGLGKGENMHYWAFFCGRGSYLCHVAAVNFVVMFCIKFLGLFEWLKRGSWRWHGIINLWAKSKRKTKEMLERGFWGQYKLWIA